jgi:hypothetical protein
VASYATDSCASAKAKREKRRTRTCVKERIVVVACGGVVKMVVVRSAGECDGYLGGLVEGAQ